MKKTQVIKNILKTPLNSSRQLFWVRSYGTENQPPTSNDLKTTKETIDYISTVVTLTATNIITPELGKLATTKDLSVLHTDVEKLDAKFVKLEENMDAKFKEVDAKFVKLEENMDAKFKEVGAEFKRLDEKCATKDDLKNTFDRFIQSQNANTNKILSIAAIMTLGLGIYANKDELIAKTNAEETVSVKNKM